MAFVPFLDLYVIGLLVALIAALINVAVLISGPRASTFLILKYLLKRRIAWVSLIAVMLCTTMVLVVISVMGGWLNMFKGAFRGLSGEIVVRSQSMAGFPYYQEMAAELEKDPDIAAAVPTIETYGLINFGRIGTLPGVKVMGI